MVLLFVFSFNSNSFFIFTVLIADGEKVRALEPTMAKKGYLTAETTTTNGGDNIKKENGDGVSDGLGW